MDYNYYLYIPSGVESLFFDKYNTLQASDTINGEAECPVGEIFAPMGRIGTVESFRVQDAALQATEGFLKSPGIIPAICNYFIIWHPVVPSDNSQKEQAALHHAALGAESAGTVHARLP